VIGQAAGFPLGIGVALVEVRAQIGVGRVGRLACSSIVATRNFNIRSAWE
jgi:hypothetical protein